MMANIPAISGAQPNQPVDDVMLMAYADNQLSPDQRSLVERQLAVDPSLQSALDAFKQTSAQVRAHWSDPAPDVPPALQNAVQAMIAKAQSSQTLEAIKPASLPFAKPTASDLQQRPAANSSWYAMVATVACVAVGTLAYFAGAQQFGSGQQLATNHSAAIVLTADTSQLMQWQQHLSNSPSGVLLPLTSKSATQQLKILATLKDAQGRLCREFSLSDTTRNTQGVACHKPGAQQNWQLQFAAHMPLEANGYTPASSTAVLDAFVTSLGAGVALSVDEERKALAALANQSQ
jgi:hypothetical protein